MQVALTGLVCSESGDVPTDFVLVKAGENTYDGGSFLFDSTAADAVMATYKRRGIRLTADYDHQSMRASGLQGGVPAAASAWTPAVVDGNLRATDVKWTKKARQMIADGEYSYFSIVGNIDTKSKRLDRIINFALTNNPAAHAIEPLVASAEFHTPEENNMSNVTIALGLSANAEEGDALVAIAGLKDFRRSVLALSGKGNDAEAMGALTALSMQAGRTAAVEAELSALKASHAKAEALSLLDAAVTDGRVSPAKRPEMVALSEKHGIEALKACLDVLPKQGNSVTEQAVELSTTAASGADILTPQDIKIAMTMGHDLDVLRASKAKDIEDKRLRDIARKAG